MTAPTITIKTGEVKSAVVTCRSQDGLAVNLTGCTIELVAKRSIQEADSAAFLTAETTTHTNAAAGITSLQINASEIQYEVRGVYDITITFAGGDVLKCATGEFIVLQSVNR
jgi:hypothetical protein